jgi:hypothetical protein
LTVTRPTDYEIALRAEISAIRRIVAAVDKLDRDAQQRVARYVADRYDRKDEK